MASYLLEYGIIFIGISNMTSYLLKYDIIFIGIYGIIFIGMWHHIYWNVASYLLEYGIIFIGICCHIYWNMLLYLLEYIIFSALVEYVIIFIIICHRIYLLLYSNSDKNYIQTITSIKFLGGIPPNNSKNIDI